MSTLSPTITLIKGQSYHMEEDDSTWPAIFVGYAKDTGFGPPPHEILIFRVPGKTASPTSYVGCEARVDIGHHMTRPGVLHIRFYPRWYGSSMETLKLGYEPQRPKWELVTSLP